jgi:hypothetical protein
VKIIQEREHHTRTEHWRVFDWENEVNWGFTFPCDEHGVVDVLALTDCARKNYAACLTGTVNGRRIVDRGTTEFTHQYTVPRMGLCDCGSEVYLDRFTNTCCGCGADYNMSGDELAPREQWGEETGETAADILGI